MIDEYFQTLTTFLPRNFQRETITKLLHRQNVLLRAPTGSGKTETAIAYGTARKRDRYVCRRHRTLPHPHNTVY